MIDLEGLAHKLTNAVCAADLAEAEKAKIEYGFSLTMGVGLTLLLALVPAALLGALACTVVMMVAALVIRLFSGGAHCSSYTRCLVLSLLIFVPGGALAKYLAETGSFWLTALICSCLVMSALTYQLNRQVKLVLPTALLSAIAFASGYLLKGSFLPEVMLPAAMGVFTQTVMVTSLGQRIVKKADYLLKHIIK